MLPRSIFARLRAVEEVRGAIKVKIATAKSGYKLSAIGRGGFCGSGNRCTATADAIVSSSSSGKSTAAAILSPGSVLVSPQSIRSSSSGTAISNTISNQAGRCSTSTVLNKYRKAVVLATSTRIISSCSTFGPFSALFEASAATRNWNDSHLLHTMGCSTSKVDGNMDNKNSSSNGNRQDNEDEYIEQVVCKESEVAENEMKAFEMGDGVGKVLIVRQNGKLSALGSKCTHYGAPLETGALGEGRVRCPWHGACFNVATGDIEDFPGLDSLPCHQLEIVNGNEIKVRAKRNELKTSKRVATMARLLDTDRSQVVIVGGGPSGNICAETLRKSGYTGRIVMVCREPYPPYDRVKVSKMLDATIDQLRLRADEFYSANGIDLKLKCDASSVDVAARNVILSDGTCLPYTKLFIATGSTPLRPNIPGVQLKNIFTLRVLQDAHDVNAALGPDKEVVILGASFIGMEAAAYCQNKVKSVTVVLRDSVPFEKSFGKEIGAAVKSLFEEKGIKFITNSGISQFLGNGSVQQVKLANDELIRADLVVLGVGSTLNTEFLQSSGINLNKRGAIEVDEFLQTNVPNVYAGGDVANAPVFSDDNRKSAIGHYGLAQYHGRIAGLNIGGKTTCQQTVPFFWTMLFGKGIRYCGQGAFDEILYTGDVAALNFAAYFIRGGLVTAVATCVLPGAAEYANRMAQGGKLYKQELGANYSAWMTKDNMKTSL